MKLPEPKLDSAFSLEKAIAERRSVRAYSAEPVSIEDIGQLLWAAQGVSPASTRTAPSAGAIYPLRTYLVAGNVSGLAAGVYRYESAAHELALLGAGDERMKLAQAGLGQEWLKDAPASLIITATAEGTTRRYREMGERYVHMEAGHAAENVYLQATALGLGTVAVGAFDAGAVTRLLWLLPHEHPLYIMPVGKPVQGD